MLVNILIILFLILIFYQIYKFLASKNIKEGVENSSGKYESYPDDPLILAKQNAGNIEVLKTEITQIPDMKTRIDNLEEDVKVLNEQIEGLNAQNTEAVNSFGGATGSLTSEDGGSGEGEGGEGEDVVGISTRSGTDRAGREPAESNRCVRG